MRGIGRRNSWFRGFSARGQQRDYYAAHREEICAARKANRKAHPEYDRAYYQQNRKKLLEYARKYRKAKKALGASG
jgi:hypothetical protein